MRKALPIIIFLAFGIGFAVIVARAWKNKPKEDHIILISKGKGSEGYERYAEWLHGFNHSIQCIDVYHLPTDSINKLIPLAYGLVLTGGPDVHPKYYGRPADTVLCGSIDLYRDSLEFALIQHAKDRKMPILGICRGLQILNVAHKGSLYADLPVQFKSNEVAHRCAEADTCQHMINTVRGSFFASLTEKPQGTVNSNHHQGIRDLANDFNVGAWSVDSLPESIEWKPDLDRGFLMAVQWHPERLEKQNPMAFPIARRFISETYAFKMYTERKAKKE